MSKMEFVAIQLGVKFLVMCNLRHYVDRVCQRYQHHFILFRKLRYFFKLFHGFTVILFILFKGLFLLIIIWIYSP